MLRRLRAVRTAAPAADSNPVNTAENPAAVPETPAADNTGSSAPATGGHTTSIYTNDESTLLRVEYYDENNHLYEFSSVSDYNKDTNSYTETVYRWDDVNQVQVPTRTDTYVNGELTSSETH